MTQSRRAFAVAKRGGLALGVVAVAVIIGLASVRVPTAEFSIAGRSDVITARLQDETTSNVMLPAKITVLGVRRLTWLDGQVPTTTFPDSVQLEAEGGGADISVPPFALPAGTRISVERGHKRDLFHVRLAGASLHIRLLIGNGGAITIAGINHPMTSPAPTPIEIETDASGVELLIERGGSDAITLLATANVDELRFWRLEPRKGLPEARLTGILGGNVTFLEVAEQPIPLNKGDDLDIELVDGVVHALTMSPDGLEINASGRADDLRKRIGFSMPSQLPTWFDRLSRLTTIRLLVALITLLAGFEIHKLLWREP